jgi:hypothetical protein
MRKRLIARDGDTCWICHQPGADTVDHIIERMLRPDLVWDLDNARMAHRSCNSRRGAMRAIEHGRLGNAAPREYCVAGLHRMEGDNVVTKKNGKGPPSRRCKTCKRDYDRQWQQRSRRRLPDAP